MNQHTLQYFSILGVEFHVLWKNKNTKRVIQTLEQYRWKTLRFFFSFSFVCWKIVIVKHSRAAEYRFISRPTKQNWRKGACVRKLSSQPEVFNRETELYGSAASSVTASAALTIEVNLPKCRTAPTDLRLGTCLSCHKSRKQSLSDNIALQQPKMSFREMSSEL